MSNSVENRTIISKLPSHILDTVDNICLKGSFSLIIRHGEREQIVSGDSGKLVDLTKTGKKISRIFGERCVFEKINNIYSSPLLRCKRTSECIAHGANQNDMIINEDHLLGDPGCYVIDEVKGGQIFRDWGNKKTVITFIEKGELPGFRTIDVGSTLLLRNILNKFPYEKNKCNIFISHDAIVLPFIAYFTGYGFTENKWLTYLDGAVIEKNECSYLIHYKDKSVDVGEKIC
jgi:broad specificity phosphatase PhoE